MAFPDPRDAIGRLLVPAEVRGTIPASPEEVFAVLSDPTTYPDWLAGAQQIRHVDADFPNPGARFGHEVGPSDETTMADDTTSLISEPPHRLQLEVHVGPVTGRVDFRLNHTSQGTELVFSECLTGRLKFAMPVMRLAILARNRASLDRLRERFQPLVSAPDT